MRHTLPHAEPGQRIGLLGGSFDPPHAGHVHITRLALQRFHLDRVWWLVSPGNPLKPDGPAAFGRRMEASRAMLADPRVEVSDLEMQFGTRYTAETLAHLRPRYRGVRFVWLMGADNLAGFHRWQDWRSIFQAVPIGVLARPGNVIAAGLSPAARVYADARLSPARAGILPLCPAPRWCLVAGPTVKLSSTAIRNRGEWNQ